MDDGASIPASVPDRDVPTERVDTASSKGRRKRRADRFLKGPIPLSWIREHVQCPADRLLLVIRAHGDMQRVGEIKVTADVLRDAGIMDRKAAYRAIKRLEASGSVSVSRKPGRRPIVRLAQTPKANPPLETNPESRDPRII
jgi:hypothetical protein